MRGFFITLSKNSFYRCLSSLVVCVLSFSLIFSPSASYAQSINLLNLPIPGAMVSVTPSFTPTMLKGVNIYPDNPLKFDFIIDKGDAGLAGEAFEKESTRLIKYFMAALTTPEDQMWVNLSPYEKDRIVPDSFGQTEMGRDLLAQDYILKQLTASLIYPEDELGKKFWDRVYKQAYEKFGTTEIPMNTFNKIWIVPETAKIYEHSKGAFVLGSHLKVMLEEDYLALKNNIGNAKHGLSDVPLDDTEVISGVSSQVIKEILIPEIEREVNEGETFANLRQIYNSVILATWYKQALKDSLLGQVYVDQNKTKGVNVEDPQVNQKIYDQYVEAFKKGVYNYIREDYDPVTQKVIPRKYFSGGMTTEGTDEAIRRDIIKQGRETAPVMGENLIVSPFVEQLTVNINPEGVNFQHEPAAASPAKIINSPEYKTMTSLFDQVVDQEEGTNGDKNVFSYIREKARQLIGDDFDEDMAEHTILQIKRELTTMMRKEHGRRQRIIHLLRNQASEYFDTVDGFGTIQYDLDNDSLEDLIPKEQAHEDMLFSSKQAIDTLSELGETTVLSDLIDLANRGLSAHTDAVGLTMKQTQLERARKGQRPDEIRRHAIEASSYFEAVRRWMSSQNMLFKAIGNLGLKAAKDSEEFRAVNNFLIQVMLNHEARGEAFYWMRQQGAYRLKDYHTSATLEALDKATNPNFPGGASPHESTVFIAMNLEAANPKSLTIGLAAGMSKLHIKRVLANQKVISNTNGFDFEQKKYQFVRLAGVLDALVSEDVDNSARIKILKRLAVVSDETALAANFLLDAIEEIVKGARDKNASLFTSDIQQKFIKDPAVRMAALNAFVRIAHAVGNILKNNNLLLYEDLESHLKDLSRATDFDKEFISVFRKTGRQVHVILGNLYRLSELKSFEDGEEYLDLNRKIVIASGGGASVAMSGVIDRITKDPALSVIGTTDNGGATLMVRAFEAIENGTFAGGFGDHVRFIYEAAVLERAPGALIIKSLLNHRFGEGPKNLVEELKSLYPDKKKKAKQSGTREDEQFEYVYHELLKSAEKVDNIGIKADYNSVKNMILMGLLHQNMGMGKEFMNPDGIYAAFESFRRLLGAKSIAVPDNPIGNEILVVSEEGEEFYGQAFYSHTPRGLSRSQRKQSALKMKSVDMVYPEVAIRSRIMGAVKRAKAIIVGLGSWGTSIGILLKNKSLVSAIHESTGDKLLITNPVLDDETRGMSWFESTSTFFSKMMGRPVDEVFKGILANNNDNLNKKVMTARPQLGTLQEVYDGKHGMYAGPNTASAEDIDYFTSKGVNVVSDINMATVALNPMRTNPDLYHANIQYVPELFAEGLIKLMSEDTLGTLTPRDEISMIRQGEKIRQLLGQHGMSLLSFGVEEIYELIAHPELVENFKKWVEEDVEPDWIRDKKNQETVFQYMIRTALEGVVGSQGVGDGDIALNKTISIEAIDGVDVQVTFLDAAKTDEKFKLNRISLSKEKGKEDAFKQEISRRLGIVEIDRDGNTVTIELPNELLEAGATVQEKIERIRAVVAFQVEKAKELYWAPSGFTFDEYTLHQAALENYRVKYGDLRLIVELSIAIPYIRFLKQAVAAGKIPNIFKDMDGTFTAAGLSLTPAMAYDAYKYHKSKGVLKTVMTAQQFEGPFKQIIEPIEQVTRRLRLAEVLSGISREEKNTNNIHWEDVAIGVSSGGAVFLHDHKRDGYIKKRQESLDPFTIELIKLAAHLTMPDVGYPVDGHQVELREPLIVEGKDGIVQTYYAAIAVIPSGRYDARRDWDPPPKAVKRNLQAVHMAKLLEDPLGMLDQVKELRNESPNQPWSIKIGDKMMDVLKAQNEEIGIVYEDIMHLLKEDPSLRGRLTKPINISSQPGGSTTIDIAPEGKGPRIPGVMDTIGVAEESRYTRAEKIIPVMSDVSPTAKGPRIPGIEEVFEEATGVDVSFMALAFIGDEISVRPGEEGTRVFGNDFTVAEEAEKDNINMNFIAHVGPTGEEIETLNNTTTPYGEEPLMPNVVDHILNYAAASIQKGDAVQYINEKFGDIKGKLGHRTLHSFGIQDYETINERQAQELLYALDINEDFAASSAIKKEVADIKGGIDLNPNEIEMHLDREKGIGLSIPVVMPELVEQLRSAVGFYPVIIDVVPVMNLPLLLGLDKGDDSGNNPINDLSYNTLLDPLGKRDARKFLSEQIAFLN